ncbi:glucan 1,3-beta-glucosidase [Coprinopsis sp. MPI-PUGE-AT-0042]|nr:glucan 1,3-beta-glucosidase [Coprinopsis sp. MPI-PUGE-AT-0042]
MKRFFRLPRVHDRNQNTFESPNAGGVTVDANIGAQACTPLGNGIARPSDPWWMESIKHQGSSPTHPDPNGYRPFRNVKDFGAVGDGVKDDTCCNQVRPSHLVCTMLSSHPFSAAISFGNRCGQGCNSSTVSPAVVYFPRGTYLVSSSIIAYYYTQLVGDPKNPPTLLASNNFEGIAVIDADPYIPGGGGKQWYVNQNNFFRSVRNFVIDVRRLRRCINIVVHMSEAANTAHQGIFMENGSGGFMGDLVFNGGRYGIWVGNQQFTVRNITVNRAKTGIYSQWNWGWTYQGLTINNCGIGVELNTGGLTIETQSTGGEAIIDAVVVDTPIFIRTTKPSNGSLAGSIALNNARLVNVPVAVSVLDGPVVLQGGTKTIASWGQGNTYRGSDGTRRFVQGDMPSFPKPASLLDSSGRIVGRTRPQYENYAVSEFVSVKDYGAKGDGRTDDTAAIQKVLNDFAGCKIIFFDAGHYHITNTLLIPAGTRMAKGSRFEDVNNPQVIFRVGEKGSVGVVEITDIILTTYGPAAGAIVVEWNIKEPSGQKAGAGMWDSHIRTAGSLSQNSMDLDSLAVRPAFLNLHITTSATGYFEGTWVWMADHDLDGDGSSMITTYSGRGILSQSQAEHHTAYQYRLVGAKDHFMGLIQTESPYFQPTPPAPGPFPVNPTYLDPTPYDTPARNPSAWALSVQQSQNIIIFGAGLYSFFNSYTQECIETRNCQTQIANIDSASSVYISVYQLSLNGQGIIREGDNINGFASTVTYWSSN